MQPDQLLKERDQISATWHQHVMLRGIDPIQIFCTRDRYVAFCIAKDWLQDTSEALLQHWVKGFSDDEFLAYIELQGLLQSTFTQQEALQELSYAISGSVKSSICQLGRLATKSENLGILS